MTVAFVAGATGYTGRKVVELLAQRGVGTYAHVRPDSPKRAEWEARFAALGARVDTTPWRVDAMREALARIGPTHCFALLGTTRAKARAAKQRGVAADYEAVDYGLTMMLLDAAMALSPSPRFVYLSAVGVGPHARGAYLRVRHRAEERLRRSGLSYAIARPSFIIGPDRDEPRAAERVVAGISDRALRLAAGLGAERLAARYRSTTSAELAAALVRLALDTVESRVFEADELRTPPARPS